MEGERKITYPDNLQQLNIIKWTKTANYQWEWHQMMENSLLVCSRKEI